MKHSGYEYGPQMSRQSLQYAEPQQSFSHIVLTFFSRRGSLQRAASPPNLTLQKKWPFAQWTKHNPIVENICARLEFRFESDRKHRELLEVEERC